MIDDRYEMNVPYDEKRAPIWESVNFFINY